MMMQTYPPLTVTFPDRSDWVLPRILSRRVRTHGDKIFLREAADPQRTWTFREMHDSSMAIGGALRHRRFEPGDRLAIMLPNCPEYILSWFGASCAGVVEVPVNPDYSGWFLEHVINLTQPRGVVTDDALARAFVASRPQLPDDLQFFVVGDQQRIDGVIAEIRAAGWSAEPFAKLLGESPTAARVDVQRHHLGAIVSTSGTTGPSKGVMMSHAQLYFFAEELINVVRLTDADVYLLANPLFHGNAQFLTAYPSLISGAAVVLFGRFSPSQFLDRIRRWDITVTNFVGVMMDWVWRQPRTEHDADNELRCIMSAPVPHSIAADFRDRFGLEAITEVFGQTEICLPFMSPYGMERPPGAAGVLVDDYFEVKLVDPDTDDEVPIGEVGELVVRTRQPWLVNSGYWGMPEATANARRNLWFHTGDGLRRDADGWFYFVDRMKDTVRRRGENVSSFEVEQAITRHDEVEECAIIAVPSEYAGGEDEIMAVVVLRTDQPAFDELVEWCRHNMPQFVIPRYWESVSELSKTPSGKVQKSKLREHGVTERTYDREAHAPVSRSR